MDNHEVVTRLRQGLGLGDEELTELLGAGGAPVTAEAVARYGEVPLSDAQLLELLDGLIVWRRGPSPTKPKPGARPRVDGNLVLKKLRIALDLREDDLVKVFAAGGREVGARGLTPWFRKAKSKHYKAVDDATLGAFLDGLAALGMPPRRGP